MILIDNYDTSVYKNRDESPRFAAIAMQALGFALSLLFFNSFLLTNVQAAPLQHPVSTFELFHSQETMTNPCTGDPLTFDFGYFKLEMTRNADVLSGYITFQQTLRYFGSLYSQREEGTFSLELDSEVTDTYRNILRYSVPRTPFEFLYIFEYQLSTNGIQGVRLDEIQVGNC
jgi:hypothetical protein